MPSNLGDALRQELREAASALTDSLSEKLGEAAEFGGEIWSRELQNAASMVNEKLKPLADAAALLGVSMKSAADHGDKAAKAQAGWAQAAGDATVAQVQSAIALTGFSLSVAGAYKELKSLAAAASPNGLQGYNQSWQLLSSIIGGQILPYMTLFSAAILTAAGLLREKFGGLLSSGFPEKFRFVAEGTKNAFDNPFRFAWRNLSPLGMFNDPKSSLSFLNPLGVAGRAAGFGQDATPGEKQRTDAIFGKLVDNFESIVKDMEESIGTTGFAQLEQAYKQVQMQAFQGDLQRKLLESNMEAVGWLRQILAELRGKQTFGA
jgi:hypothetical protein